MRQRRATERVSLALFLTGEFERRAQEAFGVPSNYTIEGGASKLRRNIEQEQLEALADEYAGGRSSLLDTATDVGVDLGKEIEAAAKQLSSLDYGENGDGLAVNDKRNSTGLLRSCTYASIADAIQTKIRAAGKLCQDAAATAAESIVVTANAIKLYCMPVCASSREGRKHNVQAQISSHKLEAASETFNIDAHSSCAKVRVGKEYALERIQAEGDTMLMWADDHSKLQPDKNLGYRNGRTIAHRLERKKAKHSDLKPAIPGVKATINSILVCVPAGTFVDAANNSTKREIACTKQGFAVCRLESERRSTPANDYYFVFKDEQLQRFMDEKCTNVISITDGGHEHAVRRLLFCFVLFGLQLSVCLWWLQVPLRDLSDA